MNILHIGKYYPPFKGGMESYLKDLSVEQSKEHNVTVLVHNHKFNAVKSNDDFQIKTNPEILRKKSLKPIFFTPIMIGFHRIIKKIYSNQKPDVIHISWPNPSALQLLVSKTAKKTPWVIQWQSDMVTMESSLFLKFAYWFFKPFEKALLNRAKAIIVSSDEYLNHSKALEDYKEKCSCISLALSERYKSSSKAELSWAKILWNNKKDKIFTIGRLTFYKNHKILIDAASKLPNTQFIIAGSGTLYDKLQSKITNLKLKNIKIIESASDEKINALFQTCDAFCLASNDRAESFGLVLLEALQFKKPILVSNLEGSGMKWIAEQSKISQTFDPNNLNDLIEKINNLRNIDHNKNDYPQEFEISYCQQKIDDIYQQIITKP